MPVKKFRSVEEMDDDIWREPGSPELFRAIREVWEFAERTIQPRFPPGVHKHRSWEEMEAQRERWEAANFEAYQERQAKARRGT